MIKGYQVDISESFLAPATEAAIDEIKWTYSKTWFFFFSFTNSKIQQPSLGKFKCGYPEFKLIFSKIHFIDTYIKYLKLLFNPSFLKHNQFFRDNSIFKNHTH